MSIFCIDSSHRNNTPLKTVLHIFEDVRRRLICHITISINIVIDSIVASLYAMIWEIIDKSFFSNSF